MADPVESASPEISAPANPAPPSDGGADYHPSQDDAAGISIYREALDAPAETPAPEAKPDVPVLPVPGAGSADDELSPEDAKLARVLNRITRLEDERNTAQKTLSDRDAQLTKLQERARLADEYERNLAEFAEQPERLFKMVKWSPEKLQDYVVNGPSKVDAATSAISREQSELRARLEKFERADAERQAQERVTNYKAALAPQLDGKGDRFPHVTTFFDKPADLADALYAIMDQTYREQKRELTVEETAQVLESTLSGHYERLNRARSKPNPSATTPAGTPKPTVPTLTNTPPTSASKPTQTDSEDDDAMMAAAVSLLRRGRV